MNTDIQVAQYLLQCQAVKLQPENPFTWASGWKSPIYCDNRVTLSFPTIRSAIRDHFCKLILKEWGQPEIVAGVATGAIAQAALVADQLNTGMVYVRSSPKTHGTENLVEGKLEKGQKVIVIEDLVSTGGSSLKAIEALRDFGCEVLGMCAIFTYGFSNAEKAFREAGVKLITLSNYHTLIQQAIELKLVDQSHLLLLSKWREAPDQWGL